MFNKVPELFFYYINIHEYIQGNKNPFPESFYRQRIPCTNKRKIPMI